MALSPKKFREMVVQMLFALQCGGQSEGLSELMQEELKVNRTYANEAKKKALDIYEKIQELDLLIHRFSRGYELERIGKMEKGILYLALTEMSLLPKPIVIAESIRLATKFCTKETAAFIHGLLASVEEGEPNNASFCA